MNQIMLENALFFINLLKVPIALCHHSSDSKVFTLLCWNFSSLLSNVCW